MEQVKLWRKNSLGIGTWRVAELFQNQSMGEILIAHSVVEGGSEVVHKDAITRNGSGRTIQQQIDLEMQSRVQRQLNKGYKRTREEALSGSTNQFGLVNPMLAQPLKRINLRGSDFSDAYVQPKFDGHRCLITKQQGDMFAYSRQGKAITSVPHILEDAERWMQDGDTIDGELYIHGMKLQTISSLIKREQSQSRDLSYHWYDMVTDKPFGQRFRLMSELFETCVHNKIELVETTKVNKMSDVYAMFKAHRAKLYEGTMLRLSTTGYQDSVRATQLIKVKEREDGEVQALEARASRDGWAILRVRFIGPDGREVEFDISAPGSVPEKTEVLQNFEAKYKGKLLTIEYAMLTDDGVPFHAVATRWHEVI